MELSKYLIPENETIKAALKKIDEGARKIVFVINKKDELIGAITDGDIRRWILKSGGIEGKIEQIYKRNPLSVHTDYKREQVKKIIIEKSIESLPVIDMNNKVVDILFWEDLFKEESLQKPVQVDLPVVIMAGGTGTRLDPFTRILPKPLIPIGEKPIIEIIMDNYAEFGITNFYISVNYKAKMIKAYFEEHASKFKFTFINEDKPLGTGGALKFLQNKINTPFFVSNCDIIINDDYSKIYDFHKSGKYAFTLVASMQHHVIPYGVCEIENNGELKKIIEKPEYDFLVNTGMYILEPDVLSLIPDNTFFHITDLIKKLQENNKNIGVYPVSEKSWIDIGRWEEYRKAVKKIGM